MKKSTRSIISLFSVIFSLTASQQSHAWGPDANQHTTHTDITAYAVENSVLSSDYGDYLRNLGFTSGLSTVFQWDVNNGIIGDIL